jgi:hypothetical protein
MAHVLPFRPAVAPPRTIGDYERAHRLVHTYGSDTLAYFALRNDKRYFFSSDGEAMIAYAYLGRYALASGDPIGRPESIDLVIREFRTMCRRQGWGCAFLAVRQSDSIRYAMLGLRSFYLGEEAVIDCAAFTLEGKKNKSMRQSVQRVARTHRFVMLAESEAGPALVDQLNDVSRRWRGRAPERGFTMALSRAVEGANPEHLLCVAFDAEGRPDGFLRLVPLFGGEPGMTLDMMRRVPGSPNGVIEFLVANAIFALRDQGVSQLSMNFALMGRLFSHEFDLTRRERMLKSVVSLGNPFFQIKSLHEFNRRFRPTWRPRVIVYEERWALPRIAVLYGGVEGFLALPLIGRYFVPERFDHGHTGSPLAGWGGLLDVADEPVQVLEPHDVGGVPVDVQRRPGDAPGDELGVGRGDQAVLATVGHQGRHVDAGEGVIDAGVGGEGGLGVVLAAVDGVGDHQAGGRAGVGHLDDLLHVGRAPVGAGGRERQIEELVQVAGLERRLGAAVGRNGAGAAGGRPAEHQGAGLSGVGGGEGQGDLTTGRPPDDRRAVETQRVDERRQVVAHLADRERGGGGVGAVPDAPQVVHRDLVALGEPAGKLGAPHRHRRALPDDEDHRWTGPELAVADRDVPGLHLAYRPEEGDLARGHGAGHLVAGDRYRRGLLGPVVGGRHGVAGTGLDEAAGARRDQQGDEGRRR